MYTICCQTQGLMHPHTSYLQAAADTVTEQQHTCNCTAEKEAVYLMLIGANVYFYKRVIPTCRWTWTGAW